MADKQPGYRKGLVLGFSVAESFILIVFILLFLLLVLLAKRDKLIERCEAKLKEQVVLLESLGEIKKRIDERLNSGGENDAQAIDDYLLSLSQAAERAAKLEKEIESLRGVADDFRELKRQLERKKGTSANLAATDVTRQLQELIENANLEHESEGEELKQSLQTCRGQVQNLQSKLSSEGKGFNYPPCSVDEDGNPDFIFDVAVTDGGMLSRENDLPKHGISLKRELLQYLRFEEDLPSSEFLRTTRPLFAYSRENNCRFFVRLYDNTGPTKKAEYKIHRRAVENHFYILDKKNAMSER